MYLLDTILALYIIITRKIYCNDCNAEYKNVWGAYTKRKEKIAEINQLMASKCIN